MAAAPAQGLAGAHGLRVDVCERVGRVGIRTPFSMVRLHPCLPQQEDANPQFGASPTLPTPACPFASLYARRSPLPQEGVIGVMYTTAMASRATIRSGITALQAEVDTYFADAHPSVDRYRVPIANHLKDARMFADSERDLGFLAQKALSQAQVTFSNAREELDRYGGPKNARGYPSAPDQAP